MNKAIPPILIIYFNRPQVLKKTLLALAPVQPSSLFFSSDAPRKNVLSDVALVAECHKVVESVVTWDCAVHHLHAEENQGCDVWVPRSIDWFFTHVEAGIILEDDCMITEAFCKFSAELLERYRDEPRIMSISAANFQEKSWGNGDYYYSRYPAIWGWATWSRAWQHFDSQLACVDAFINSPAGLNQLLTDSFERKYWIRFYRGLKSGKYPFWDAKWVLSVWANDGISITPNQNLVSNIGFGPDATHTKTKPAGMEMIISEIASPLRSPENTRQFYEEADSHLFKVRYKPKFKDRIISLKNRLLGLMSLFLKRVPRL
ncbi:hypothetical protein LJC19_02115 [Oxalobacter sp. OttesenSCG-928-P03]|nr:hypothetical protein [Oxalobacter sp. OttesenSCG-928-P03]